MWRWLTQLFRTGDNWRRFTVPAKKAVYWSLANASERNETVVEPEHLLCGLLLEGENAAVRVLDRLGVSRFAVYAELERQRPALPSARETDFRLLPDAKRAIDLALQVAPPEGPAVLGTGHLLLGLFRGGVGPASRTLEQCGLRWEPAHREVLALQEHEATEPIRDQAEVTDRLRRVVHRAGLAAQANSDGRVWPVHLLDGLLQDEACIGAQLLDGLAVDRRQLRTEGDRKGGPPPIRAWIQNTWGWHARWVGQLTSEEARLQSHRVETTGHLLLALIQDTTVIASQRLSRHGVGLESARRLIAELPTDEPMSDQEKAEWSEEMARDATAGST
jgi:ATP-dependent Clp protease ATP-binding subunit ClpA